MSIGFPLYIDLSGNNCTIFGGDGRAAWRAKTLLLFGAKVTVIATTLCNELQALSKSGSIRHIPRRYFRGDCSNAQLCVAAEDSAINLKIAEECKAKNIPVNVTEPKVYGTFRFPKVRVQGDTVVSVAGDMPEETLEELRQKLETTLPTLLP